MEPEDNLQLKLTAFFKGFISPVFLRSVADNIYIADQIELIFSGQCNVYYL